MKIVIGKHKQTEELGEKNDWTSKFLEQQSSGSLDYHAMDETENLHKHI